MPLRLMRALWHARLQHPAALLLMVALTGTSAPLATAGPGDERPPSPVMSRGVPLSQWSAVEGPLPDVPDTMGPLPLNPVAAPVLRPGLSLGAASRVVDALPPRATLDPLTVEFGAMTLRWRDTDGGGSGIVERIVRVEAAPATPTGCGEFAPGGGFALEPGDYRDGALALGTPPSSGCLRVSLELTDRVGYRSTATSEPYRIQPPIPVVKAKPAAPAWSGKYNLYRANAFVTQKTFTWCVAASVQMMVNLVRNRSDRSRATQARMIAYAQRWDNGPYGEDGGTDVTGWIAALRKYGAGPYRVVGATTAARALRIAATAMRQTGRPAGILVMEGTPGYSTGSRAEPIR